MLLAEAWHGPGPWILLFPLVWVVAIAGVATFFRRVGGFRGGPWRGPWSAAGAGPAAGGYRGFRGPAPTPVEVLNRRYADGEIDEYEYRARLSVLTEDQDAGPAAAAGPEDGPR